MVLLRVKGWSTLSLLLVSSLVVISSVAPVVHAVSFTPTGGMNFCKCTCFSNSTILPIYVPKDPSKPCLTCTRQWCLDQKLPACLNAKALDEDLDTGTGEEGDVAARCFQRDSPKSHVVVVLFIVLTSLLLAAAILKEYAGLDIPALYSSDGVRGVVFALVDGGQALAANARRRRARATSTSSRTFAPMSMTST